MCLLFFYTIRVDPQNFDFRPKIHFFQNIGCLEIFNISYLILMSKNLKSLVKNTSNFQAICQKIKWCSSRVLRKRLKNQPGLCGLFFVHLPSKHFRSSVAVLRILALCKLIVTSQHQHHQEHIASTTFGPPPPPLLLPTQNIKNILQQAHSEYMWLAENILGLKCFSHIF